MHNSDRQAYPEDKLPFEDKHSNECNLIPQPLTETQINYLSKIENHLFYNQECDPKMLFDLYRQIWQQQEIIATGSKAEHELLKSGLVFLDQHKIRLAPALDHDSFNDSWIENQLMRLQPYSKIKLKLFNLDIKASLPYKVLTEVNFWTGGQPFLTQKVCQIIRDRQSYILRNQEVAKISQLVHRYIIDDWEQGAAAAHLLQLRSRLLSYPGSTKSLLLSYQEIWHSQSITFKQTPEQEHLLTIGLIKLEKDKVQIANPIYHDIFDHVWSKNQLAENEKQIDYFEQNHSPKEAWKPIRDDVKSNFSRVFKIILFFLFVGGITGLGVDLITKYRQLQEIQKIQQVNDLLVQKKHSAAIAAYDRLLQTDTNQPHLLWINRGYAWSGLNQYDEMLRSCAAATLIKPQAPLAWNCRGEALYYLGQPQAALEAFKKAIAINSQDSTFWLNQSRVLADLQQYNQAISASEQGIKLLSKSKLKKDSDLRELAIAFNQQGQSWLETKQNQQALSAFKRSLEYLPNYLPAQQGRGIALYRLGYYSQAVAAFTEVLQRDDLTREQSAINWLYQGISLCETPQITSATQAFKQVLKLTKNPEARAIAKAGCGIR